MIFSEDMLKAVLSGRKTCTTRPFSGKPENWKRPPYSIGRSYAIQPGRGKKAVGRIIVTGTQEAAWFDKLRAWGDRHAQMEGFDTFKQFEQKWRSLYGDEKWRCPLLVIDFKLIRQTQT